MTRAITALVAAAGRENQTSGVVSTDTMMALAAEGYDLGALCDDVYDEAAPADDYDLPQS